MSNYVGQPPAKSLNAPEGGGLGYGQIWKDMVGQRVFGTYYLNDTGGPIFVSTASVSNLGTPTYFNMAVYVNNEGRTDGVGDILVCYKGNYAASDGYIVNGEAIVPNGCTYRVNSSNGALNVWSELRP